MKLMGIGFTRLPPLSATVKGQCDLEKLIRRNGLPELKLSVFLAAQSCGAIVIGFFCQMVVTKAKRSAPGLGQLVGL